MSLRQVSITSYVYSKRERRDYFNPSILKSTWFQNSRNLTVILQSHKIILDALSFNMASALLLMQFSAWTRIGKKTDTPLIQWSFYLLNTSSLSVLVFFIIESSVLKVLVFDYRGMLEKVSDVTKRTQINAVQTCGITFSEIRQFLENHSLQFHEIWRKNSYIRK